MTRAQQIARLEAILVRVLARVASRAGPVAPAATVEPRAPVTDADTEFEWPTRPPPPPESEAPPPERAVAASDAQERAPQATTLGAKTHPVDAPDDASLDSRERLVAAQLPSPSTAASGPAADAGADAVASADASAVEVTPSVHPSHAEQPPPPLEPELAPDTEIEQPPASSRRPVAPEPEEQIARIAFGDDVVEPPRHTPPPESGQLPAPDESDLESDLDSPATIDPFDAQTDEHALSASAAGARPSPSRLVVVETRAVLAGDGDVAEMTNVDPIKQPETFVELLRVSLAL
jgi:hypothetical protein